MELRQWLEEKELTTSDFAAIIRVSPATVFRWLKDHRAVPTPDLVRIIHKKTHGRVTPCDLYHIRCTRCAVCQTADAEADRQLNAAAAEHPEIEAKLAPPPSPRRSRRTRADSIAK